jgi:hypothetical protein
LQPLPATQTAAAEDDAQLDGEPFLEKCYGVSGLTRTGERNDRGRGDVVVLAGPIVYVAMAIGILDAAAHPDSVWRKADQNKLVWVLVQLLPVTGTLAYAILVRPALVAAEMALHHNDDEPAKLRTKPQRVVWQQLPSTVAFESAAVAAIDGRDCITLVPSRRTTLPTTNEAAGAYRLALEP